MNNIYSEKELMIFSGVTTLLNQGIRLHTIKVADIAEAAGIGKGTIYEYFKSKEEIIEKTLVYSFSLEISKTIDRINSVNGFKNKCHAIFEMMEKGGKESCSPAGLLLSDLSLREFSQYINNDRKAVRDREKIAEDVINELIVLGVREGIIKEQPDKEYQATVFLSVILGFINSMGYKRESNQFSIEAERERAYTLLVKGLS